MKLEVSGIAKKKVEYYFSVIDVISALTDCNISKRYWSDLKKRLTEEGSKLYENIVRLKLKAQDGKLRETDTLDTKGILRLIELVPSPKAEPLKLWLTNLSSEKEEYHFRVAAFVNALANPKNARKYWSVLKTRLKKEGNEVTTNCSQLKIILVW